MQFFRLPERAGITEKACQIVTVLCKNRQIGIRILLSEISADFQSLPMQFFRLPERVGIMEKECQIVAAV